MRVGTGAGRIQLRPGAVDEHQPGAEDVHERQVVNDVGQRSGVVFIEGERFTVQQDDEGPVPVFADVGRGVPEPLRVVVLRYHF